MTHEPRRASDYDDRTTKAVKAAKKGVFRTCVWSC